MSNNFNIKLCIALLLSLFFIFLSSHDVFGYDRKITDIRVWSLKPVISGNLGDLSSLVSTLKSRDEYYTGNYYYFAFYCNGNNQLVGGLIRKDLCNASPPTILTNLQDLNRRYTLFFKVGNGNLHDGLICVQGNNNAFSTNGQMYLTIDDLDYDKHTGTVLFATDFDKDIVYENSQGGYNIFYYGQPFISQSDYDLSNLMFSDLYIYPNNADTEIFKLNIINNDNNSVLKSIDLSLGTELYDKYYKRSDPFDTGSSSVFIIPKSELLSNVVLTNGIKINWQIVYSSNNQIYTIDRLVSNLIDYNTSSSTGRRSRRTEEVLEIVILMRILIEEMRN